ncbi:MAG: hypothetical protein WC551_06905 [Patescibacteria group bacterium]
MDNISEISNEAFEAEMAEHERIMAEEEFYDLNDNTAESAAIAREEMQPFIDAADQVGLIAVMTDAARRRCLGQLMVGIWEDESVPNSVVELMMPEFIRISSDRNHGLGRFVHLSPDDDDILYDRDLKQWAGEVYTILKKIYGDDW